MPTHSLEGDLDLAGLEENSTISNRLSAKPKVSAPSTAEPHARMRKRVHDKIELQYRLAASLPWGLAALILVTACLTAIAFRTDLVRAWPKSATMFAAIGQPANLYGIDIRRVQARAGQDDKGPRIVIGGVLASVSRKPEAVPYLRVSLVDVKGIQKLSWLVDPGIEILEPGKFRTFESARSNPIVGDLRAIVEFAEPPLKAPRSPPPLPEPPTGKSGLMGAKGPLEPNSASQANRIAETVTAR